MFLALCIWGAFAIWFLVNRWTFIGAGESIAVLLLVMPVALLSSLVSKKVARPFQSKGLMLRALSVLVAASVGSVIWYLVLAWVSKLVVVLALRFNFAERANNVVQFFYMHDAHFFTVFVSIFFFMALTIARQGRKAHS